MKSTSLVIVLCFVLFINFNDSRGEEIKRTGRSKLWHLDIFEFLNPLNFFNKVFSNWYSGLNNLLPRCTGCPPRPCVRDSAVVHGYCCGCSRVSGKLNFSTIKKPGFLKKIYFSDFLPIDCPGIHVNCPADGRRLCRDYDYMLDCCCP